MSVHGVVELIWHFAGYFRTVGEVERSHDNPDGGPHHQSVPYGLSAEANSYHESSEIDLGFDGSDLSSSASPLDDDESHAHIAKLVGKASGTIAPALQAATGINGSSPVLHPSGGGGSGGDGDVFLKLLHDLKMMYEEIDTTTLATIEQVHTLNDNDILISDIAFEKSGFTEGNLNSLVDGLDTPVPPALTTIQFTTSAVTAAAASLTEQDVGSSTSVTTVQANPVIGTYINGELQTGDSTTSSTQALPHEPHDILQIGDDGSLTNAPVSPARDVASNSDLLEMGSNHSTNEAVLLDLNEANGAMVVLGDYHQTSAVIQVNVVQSATQIGLDPDGGLPIKNIVASVAQNTATFQHQSMDGGYYGGPGNTWHVDVFQGTLWNVNLLQQINLVVDNDVAVIGTGDYGAYLGLGSNTQLNLAMQFNFGEQYDLIVIGGDYLSTNAIRQTNVIINNDAIMLPTSGAAALPTTTTTAKSPLAAVGTPAQTDETTATSPESAMSSLINRVDMPTGDVQVASAALEDDDRYIDGEGIVPFTIADALHSASDAVVNHEWDAVTTAAPEVSEPHPMTASGGGNSLLNEATIKVHGTDVPQTLNEAVSNVVTHLVQGATELAGSLVKEAFENINGSLKVLYVTGNYYDVNVVMQTNYVLDQDIAVLTQSASTRDAEIATGTNQAVNAATIVDAGTLSNQLYLGGHQYSDSLLIQTNIIQDNDRIVYGDPNSLVNEIVAFTDMIMENFQISTNNLNVPNFHNSSDLFGQLFH